MSDSHKAPASPDSAIRNSPYGLRDPLFENGPRDATVQAFQARFSDLCAHRRPATWEWFVWLCVPVLGLFLRAIGFIPLPPEDLSAPRGMFSWITVFEIALLLFLVLTPLLLKRLNILQCVWWLFIVPWFFLHYLDSDYLVGITLLVFVISTFYLFSILARLFSVLLGLVMNPEVKVSADELQSVDSETGLWPKYTVLVPMYHETNVAKTLLRAMSNLDYPVDRLEVLILLEADDTDTIEQFRNLTLPAGVQVLIVPEDAAGPKGKPRACNHGLAAATGEYLVIFDAEDRPDPDQLKKAVTAFRKMPDHVICLQAKLNYFNPYQNLLTACFTIEYNTWYELFLPGLHAARAPIPLGGTSNHFRAGPLRAIGGWDPYNVTEDCDLGLRLYRMGYRTRVLDSTTWEEANSRLGNWIRQRSRWVKGYMQTHLVHSRNPLRSMFGWFKRPAAIQPQSTQPQPSQPEQATEGNTVPAPAPMLRERGMGPYGYVWNLLSIGGLSAMLLMNILFWLLGGAYLGRHVLADRFAPGGMLSGVSQAREIRSALQGWQLMYTRGTSEQNEGRTIYDGAAIEHLDEWSLLSQIFFPGLVAMVVANGVFILYGLLAVIKRRQWGLAWYLPLIPFYWVLISIAAWKGAWQLLFKPYYWEKTVHALVVEDPPPPDATPSTSMPGGNASAPQQG